MNKGSILKLNHTHPNIAKQLWTVFQQSYQVEADLIGAKEFPPLKRMVSDLQSSSTEFYGYLKNELLAGVIELNHIKDQLEICSLVVSPDFFRQGIASQLMYFAMKTFNHELCVVETAVANVPAIKLYERLGFKRSKCWITPSQIEKLKLIRDLRVSP